MQSKLLNFAGDGGGWHVSDVFKSVLHDFPNGPR